MVRYLICMVLSEILLVCGFMLGASMEEVLAVMLLLLALFLLYVYMAGRGGGQG